MNLGTLILSIISAIVFSTHLADAFITGLFKPLISLALLILSIVGAGASMSNSILSNDLQFLVQLLKNYIMGLESPLFQLQNTLAAMFSSFLFVLIFFLIQNAATYSLDYDPEMDQAANVAIAFLDQYREGVCTHYASAATLLYRTLGIPARYVEGFMIETKKDDFVQVKSPGHAWVEVYCDGVGWIRVEVTGGMKDGIGDSEADTPDLKHTIEIMLYPIQKYYDGQPAFFQDGDYEIIAPDGVDVDLELNISITNVDRYRLKYLNMYTDTFASYRVYQNGVDVTEQYSIVFTSVNGTDENEIVIQVDPRKIQLATASQTKYDDGTALTNSSVTIVKGSLANGHHLETTVEGYIDAPGSTENIITHFRIVDDEGNDFSYCYNVSIILGTLTIIPAPEE